MKKMKIGLPLLALFAGVLLSAFAPKGTSSSNTDALYWFTITTSHNPDSYDGNGLQVEADEMSITGCDNSVPTQCRYGYTADQLNFDSNGNPVSVKQVSPGVYESPAEIITKHSN